MKAWKGGGGVDWLGVIWRAPGFIAENGSMSATRFIEELPLTNPRVQRVWAHGAELAVRAKPSQPKRIDLIHQT